MTTLESDNSRGGYCYRCGHLLAARWIESEGRDRLSCPSCGWVEYQSPKVLVMCMAHTADRLLLCRRALEPARGLWSPPAGFLESGENLEAAAVRESWEEAGVRLDPGALELAFIASLPHINQVYIGFRASLQQDPVTRPGPESLEVRMCSAADFPAQQLAFARCMGSYYQAFFRQLSAQRFALMRMRIEPRDPARAPGTGEFGEPIITYE